MIILLTKNMVAQIDVADHFLIKSHKWYATKSAHNWYAATNVKRDGVWKRLYMHRLIMNCNSSEVVHHVDGNSLNNHRANLLICCQSTNLSYRKRGAKCTGL